MWTAPEVMSRFVEAADTERRTPSKGMQQARTCWPAYRFDAEDRKGWTEDDQAEEQNRWAETKGAKADAVSRYDECVEWGVTYIDATRTRQIVWTWAFCQVIPGRSFAKECRSKGWARPTAYRRLHTAFEQIAYHLDNERILLRPATLRWLRQVDQSGVHPSSTVRDCAPVEAIPFTPSFRTDRHADLIRTDADAERFAAFLEDHNRRNEGKREAMLAREAKRRQKLGLDAA